MGDVVFLAVTVAFFAITVLLVKACDRIIGPDPDRSAEAAEQMPTTGAVATTAQARR
jgi:hypothetical protein